MPLPISQNSKDDKEDGKTVPENSLQNLVVLRKILSLNILTFSDLKNFRLVSTYWYHASLDHWYKTAVVKLLPSTKIRTPLSLQDLEGRYTNNTFLSRLGPKPYSMYKIKGWKPRFDPIRSEIIEVEYSFGEIVTPFVEYLHVEQCNFTRPEKFEDLVLSCLNLKELVLSGNAFIPSSNRAYDTMIPVEKQLVHLKKVTIDGLMTLGWEQFLFHAPNVETLIYKQNNSYSQYSFSSFLHALTNLQCRHRFRWPIKHLNLAEATGTYKDLTTLRYHEFPLETLTIQFERYQTETFFRPILQGTAKTLKYLEIIRVSDKIDAKATAINNNSMDFPCNAHFDHLTELYIWGSVVDNLDFLRFTPKLETVEINRNCYEKRHLMTYTSLAKTGENFEPFDDDVDVVQRTVGCWNNLATQPVMLMESLGRLMVDCKLGVGSLYTMRRWLPNLKELGMVFENQTFTLACEEWPRLVELTVMFGSLVTDDVITAQYFLNLKCLKKFKLDAYCNKGWLTDKSVHDGFLKIPALQYLSICVSKQMTVEAEAALQKKIPYARVIRNYGNGTHPGYECCQRMAFIRDRKKIYEPNTGTLR